MEDEIKLVLSSKIPGEVLFTWRSACFGDQTGKYVVIDGGIPVAIFKRQSDAVEFMEQYMEGLGT